jgi:hypothetical protein
MTSSLARAVFDELNTALADFIHREDRTALQASLFDVPRRTELGAYCYGEHVGAFIAEVAALASPEDLGHIMRAPARRPNSLHIVGIPWLYLFDRERRILSGEPERPAAERDYILEFCGRVLATYRGNGSFVPRAPAWDMRIMDMPDVVAFANTAEVCSAEHKRELRRLVATLELYAFVLHGEHRDGIYDHGPYELPQGEQLVVKDFTDLRNDFLPWAGQPAWLPVQALAVAYILPTEVHCQFDLWGTARCEGDRYEWLRRAAVVTFNDDGQARPLPADDWPAFAAAAQEAQKRLFLTVAQWPAEERARYGARLFANHLREIPRALHLPQAIEEALIIRFDASASVFMRNYGTSAISPVWAALRRERPFTPIY